MLNELQQKGTQPLAPALNVTFSYDAMYLAVHSSTFPNHLWIYSLREMSFIAVLCQLPSNGPIKDFDWHPELPYLGLVTGSEYIYFWQPEGCHCIPQPFEKDERCSRTFKWATCENGMLLLAGENSCCLAIPEFTQ